MTKFLFNQKEPVARIASLTLLSALTCVTIYTLVRILGFANSCWSTMIVILLVVTLAVDSAVQTRAGHAAELLFNTSSTAAQVGYHGVTLVNY